MDGWNDRTYIYTVCRSDGGGSGAERHQHAKGRRGDKTKGIRGEMGCEAGEGKGRFGDVIRQGGREGEGGGGYAGTRGLPDCRLDPPRALDSALIQVLFYIVGISLGIGLGLPLGPVWLTPPAETISKCWRRATTI